MNIRKSSVALSAIVLLASPTMHSYKLKVVNASPFIIEAYCEKIGALATKSITIAPNDTDSIDCRGGDCITGIKVEVQGRASGWKDVTLHSTWSARCRNLTAHVLAIPQYKKEINKKTGKTKYTLKGFKLSVSRNMAISSESQPFVCSQEL